MWDCDHGDMSTTGDTAQLRLAQGDIAPDFTVETTQGTLSLRDLVEESRKGVVVYFYPKASTPGCTTEACDFRDNLNSLKGAGYTVIGISPDKMPALERFRDKQQLNFPLASDPDKEVMRAWGTYGPKQNYGRLIQGVIRSTIVVGKDGRVELARYNVKAKGHVARLRTDLGVDQPQE